MTLQSRIVLPIAVASLAMGIAFGVLAVLERSQVYRLKIATGSTQGQYYAFSRALAEVVAQHEPNIQIEVIATQGSVQNMQMLESRAVQLALVQSDTAAVPSARAVATLFPEMLHIVAANNSGIETLADLRGKRIALMPVGSGSYDLFWLVARHYGFAPETLDHVALSSADARAAFLNGEVDALSQTIALGNPTTSAFLQASAATLVPIRQVEALQISQPFLSEQIFPRGTYGGDPAIPNLDTPAVAVQAIVMARADVDPQPIREIVRVLNEHRSELIALHAGSAAIPAQTADASFGVPLHPGAEGYYTQDEPNFLVTYAETIGLIVSLGVLTVSGLWQFHQRWLQRQKNRADRYNMEIIALLDRIYAARDLEQLEELRMQLFEILQNVVEDFDFDRINSESFEAFTFPWGVAITSIRHRELMIREAGAQAAVSPNLLN
ncbi:TAXI family TRAP transporter solute-binding subunit [Synechococcus sp. PCC 7336]|uniref:TAXI family TRAP transporter solute-binding subunit n=1 Tax=Synechococcus sp. PCC 7336 TaxID=195250 RepID=UPI000348E360|nr:TAXI family TRAP transporter solute-binding subunit [Synechococcus sp. PCC 7336]